MYPCVSSSEPSPEKITTLSDFSLMYFDIRNMAVAGREKGSREGDAHARRRW